MVSRLLKTKFFIPAWRSDAVSRPRLLERLQEGLHESRKLTLISAPAGYGKTTLAAEWIHTIQADRRAAARVAWLSLEEGDNDPSRFLRYFVSALQSINETLGQSTPGLLGMHQLPPLFAIFDEIINDLAGLEDRSVLFLDDYHVINNPSLHEALEYFLEHQPPSFHVAITTREDPPLSLARMRARRQITEIRAHDLRFTFEEASQFFEGSMNLDLDVETIHALEAQTEGWAVGLQLAALAMQNLPSLHESIDSFSGSHRYIIDYLLDEVLKSQPPEISEFLSKTAPLKRFNAELCQAVTGNPAAAKILAELERSNLFLIPLDDQRGWYRYHHLFANVLSAGLAPDVEHDILVRAAQWFESQGLLAEAIPYYGKGVALKEATYLMDTFNYMNSNPAITDDGFNTFQDLASSEYGLYDKVNWFRGPLGETLDVVYPQLWEVDFRTQAPKLEVPVYFLLGRHDVNAPPVLAEEYYELLDAPHKELIWFEHSGHNPWVNESANFVDVVLNNVLVDTRP